MYTYYLASTLVRNSVLCPRVHALPLALAAVSKLSRSDAGPVSRPQIVGKSAGLNQIKKAITTLQIAQFIVSETLAVSELFANGV